MTDAHCQSYLILIGPVRLNLPPALHNLSPYLTKKRGSYKGYTGTSYKSAIAAIDEKPAAKYNTNCYPRSIWPNIILGAASLSSGHWNGKTTEDGRVRPSLTASYTQPPETLKRTGHSNQIAIVVAYINGLYEHDSSQRGALWQAASEEELAAALLWRRGPELTALRQPHFELTPAVTLYLLRSTSVDFRGSSVSPRGRGGVVVRLLVSHLDEPGPIPDGSRSRIFACENSAGRCHLSGRFPRGSPVSPNISFRRSSIPTPLHPHGLPTRPRCYVPPKSIHSLTHGCDSILDRGLRCEQCFIAGVVQHDSHWRKSAVTLPGIEPGSPWWEASRLTAQPPRPPTMKE
ncbi:hypothetical protein PR048_022923 [Dryococelus australis]|uniref:Uncharacterized protein n=1 Tax=Dryococelus australis TaxID=614101 RepID=A0ABQ9GSM5_9NEOP|nr:hypothetical protein PR048_022923 [Dryococelus australis]